MIEPHYFKTSEASGASCEGARQAETACQCAISRRVVVPVTIYRRSVVAHWPATPTKPRGSTWNNTTRGDVGDLSAKSARRLLFGLANSPRDWGAMATLTFRECQDDGLPSLRRFARILRNRGFAHLHWAWVREYQGRGAVHYHAVWEKDGLQAGGFLESRFEDTVGKGGRARAVIRGPLESRIVQAWTEAVGDLTTEFQRFQWGGIVEPLKEDTSIVRYFASYLGKAEQKARPEGSKARGRWWWIDPRAKPVPVWRGYATGWPFEKPFSVVFDGAQMHDYVSSSRTQIVPPYQTK